MAGEVDQLRDARAGRAAQTMSMRCRAASLAEYVDHLNRNRPIAPWGNNHPTEGRFPTGWRADGFVSMIGSDGLIHEYQQVA